MAITGFKSLKEAAQYTMAVNQVALPEEAINATSWALWGRKENNHWQTT
jgi:hypothetical protein